MSIVLPWTPPNNRRAVAHLIDALNSAIPNWGPQLDAAVAAANVAALAGAVTVGSLSTAGTITSGAITAASLTSLGSIGAAANIVAAGRFQPTAPATFLAGSIYNDATNGLQLAGGGGSSYDLVLLNKFGQGVLSIPTGQTYVVAPNCLHGDTDIANAHSSGVRLRVAATTTPWAAAIQGNGGTGLVAIGCTGLRPALQGYTSGFGAVNELHLNPLGGVTYIGITGGTATSLVVAGTLSLNSQTTAASATGISTYLLIGVNGTVYKVPLYL